MTGFGRAQPGGSRQPVFSARYHNTIIDTINARGWMNDVDRDLADRFDQQTSVLKVYNHSGDIKKGDILGVSYSNFDYDDNPIVFPGTDPCFFGVIPNQTKHAARFVVALNHCEATKIVPCVASGWVQSRVKVTDETAIRSQVVDDKFNLETSPHGNVPTIIAEKGIGLKWCLVHIPNTMPDNPIPGVSSNEDGTKAEWVADEKSIKDGCIHVWPLIEPEVYNPSNTYAVGDRVRVDIESDCLEWVYHEATDETTGTFDSSKWEAKTGQRYIDKESVPQKWWHGMAEAPDEGHYCVGVKGELVYYDCFKIPGYA